MQAAKIDANQTNIVAGLRRAGATVQSLATIGKGCPDILVGFRGKNILMEIKDGELSRSRQALTALQIVWHSKWEGEVHVITSLIEALKVLEIYETR